MCHIVQQIRQSRVTPDMIDRAQGDLSDSLRQALDEWLDKSKKGIAEAVWEDPHSQKLEQDVSDIKSDMKKLLSGSQGN